MKMKRKKYIKIVAGILIFILFIIAFGYGLQYIDNKTEKTNVSDEDSINDWNVQVARGKIKLNKKKYDYYHDFENYLLMEQMLQEMMEKAMNIRAVWQIF